MITLHRLGHVTEPFYLNPDLIVTVEANPDTVITLATGAKIVVAEPPERVTAQISAYRVEILSSAMRRRHESDPVKAPATAARHAAHAVLTALDHAEAELSV